jgi:hypothetical protein
MEGRGRPLPGHHRFGRLMNSRNILEESGN